MRNTRLPNSIFFMLVVLGTLQSVYYAPRIPEFLGSHFARGGFVNGWQTKTAFFSTELAIIVLATVVSFGIPRVIGGMPVCVSTRNFGSAPSGATTRSPTFACGPHGLAALC